MRVTVFGSRAGGGDVGDTSENQYCHTADCSSDSSPPVGLAGNAMTIFW
jgi:hypothetical protein